MTLSNLTEAEKTILMDETVTDLKQSLETAIKVYLQNTKQILKLTSIFQKLR